MKNSPRKLKTASVALAGCLAISFLILFSSYLKSLDLKESNVGGTYPVFSFQNGQFTSIKPVYGGDAILMNVWFNDPRGSYLDEQKESNDSRLWLVSLEGAPTKKIPLRFATSKVSVSPDGRKALVLTSVYPRGLLRPSDIFSPELYLVDLQTLKAKKIIGNWEVNYSTMLQWIDSQRFLVANLEVNHATGRFTWMGISKGSLPKEEHVLQLFDESGKLESRLDFPWSRELGAPEIQVVNGNIYLVRGMKRFYNKKQNSTGQEILLMKYDLQKGALAPVFQKKARLGTQIFLANDPLSTDEEHLVYFEVTPDEKAALFIENIRSKAVVMVECGKEPLKWRIQYGYFSTTWLQGGRRLMLRGRGENTSICYLVDPATGKILSELEHVYLLSNLQNEDNENVKYISVLEDDGGKTRWYLNTLNLASGKLESSRLIMEYPYRKWWWENPRFFTWCKDGVLFRQGWRIIEVKNDGTRKVVWQIRK